VATFVVDTLMLDTLMLDTWMLDTLIRWPSTGHVRCSAKRELGQQVRRQSL